jgi:hypothetical protein
MFGAHPHAQPRCRDVRTRMQNAIHNKQCRSTLFFLTKQYRTTIIEFYNISMSEPAATMSIEELTARIGELGEMVKTAKTEKKPKEEWEPSLHEMLSLKVRVLIEKNK